jgi:multidrug efflux pump subunit AcrA (membrane-fusion protein)
LRNMSNSIGDLATNVKSLLPQHQHQNSAMQQQMRQMQQIQEESNLQQMRSLRQMQQIQEESNLQQMQSLRQMQQHINQTLTRIDHVGNQAGIFQFCNESSIQRKYLPKIDKSSSKESISDLERMEIDYFVKKSFERLDILLISTLNYD